MRTRYIGLTLLSSAALLACNLLSSAPPATIDRATLPPAGQATPVSMTPLAAPTADQPNRPLGPSNIAHVWANEGGDKVTRDELRATNDPNSVLNSVWDGAGISLFGARNEVVSFNLML